jgi:ABC-type Mn2+/Zn2+ transport system ATPase subunit
MKIKSISWKNFGSYGNNAQQIVFDENQGNFYIVLGSNGAGKCLDKETNIEIFFDDKDKEERFKKFLKNREPV